MHGVNISSLGYKSNVVLASPQSFNQEGHVVLMPCGGAKTPKENDN